jgi:hypothetical protein
MTGCQVQRRISCPVSAAISLANIYQSLLPGKSFIVTEKLCEISTPSKMTSRSRGSSDLTTALRVSAMLVFGVFILAACGTSTGPGKTEQTATAVVNAGAKPPITATGTAVLVVSYTDTPTTPSTITALARPTDEFNDPNAKSEFETAVAKSDAQLALTHIPTRTPGEPPVYPTVTPQMGIQDCADANDRGPQCYNAWRGVLNGEIIQVEAGHEGSDGDESQGLLRVWTWTTHKSDIYLTPRRVGWMEIVSVDGMRFTLGVVQSPWTTTTPTTTFTFDLSTRQWIDSTQVPSPLVSVSPMPSISPLSTQQP